MRSNLCSRVETSIVEEYAKDPAFNNMFEAAEQDGVYQQLIEEVVKGRSKKELVKLPRDHPAKSLSYCWDQISVLERAPGDRLLLLDGERVIVPQSQRAEVLRILHLPHQGVPHTLAAAKARYWWPGLRDRKSVV